MKYLYLLGVALFVALIIAVVQPQKASIARGAYIVNQVVLCGNCHTPMLANGQPDNKHRLTGTKLFFKPIAKIPLWADIAPNLTPAGFLKSWTDAQLVKFLMTGVTPSGVRAELPMPQFRMNEADAASVRAYLRSLPATESEYLHHH